MLRPAGVEVEPPVPFALAREALVLATTLSLPIVAIAAFVGLIVGALQSATSIQDAALSHFPRLVAVAFSLTLAAPWIARTLLAFASRAFGS